MRLKHGRVELELHELKTGTGPALLLLHALFGSSADWGEAPAVWPGAVYALDFCGHGRSQWVRGEAYYAELLVGDADAALARLGRAAVAGAGLGAYVALLLAGARSDAVTSILLMPGAGLAGGGPEPDFEKPPPRFDRHAEHLSFDPAVHVLEQEVRPPTYVAELARLVRRILLLEDAEPRPPWWETVRELPAARPISGDVQHGLRLLAECRRE